MLTPEVGMLGAPGASKASSKAIRHLASTDPLSLLIKVVSQSNTQKSGSARFKVACAILICVPLLLMHSNTLFNYVIPYYFPPQSLPHSVPKMYL